MVAPSLEQFVRYRAGNRCEYCRFPQAYHVRRFHIDHVIARKHVDDEQLDNLALACYRCNGCKGTNIAGIDPVSKVLTPLFNPRKDTWDEHFSWEGAVLVGTTAIGRVTVKVLNINDESAVRLRRALMRQGKFQ